MINTDDFKETEDLNNKESNDEGISESTEVVTPNTQSLTSWIKNSLMPWVCTIALSLAIALIITSFVKPTLVVGYSMYPTLVDKDYMIINRISYKIDNPEHRDIVVFESTLEGGKYLIKRVIAVEGDKLTIKDGNVYINDELQDEPYINQDDVRTIGDIDTVVPEDCVFVMGDNRNNSLDSRFSQVGFVKTEDILGKVFVRVFPFDKMETY